MIERSASDLIADFRVLGRMSALASPSPFLVAKFTPINLNRKVPGRSNIGSNNSEIHADS